MQKEGDTGTLSPASPGTKERVRRGWTQAGPHARHWALDHRARLPLVASLPTLVVTPGPALGTAASLDVPGEWPLPAQGPASRGRPFLYLGSAQPTGHLCIPGQPLASSEPPGAPCKSQEGAGLVRARGTPMHVLGWPLASSGTPGLPCTSWDGRWPHPGPQDPPLSPGTASGLVWAPGTLMHVLGWPLASSRPPGPPCTSWDGRWPRLSPQGTPLREASAPAS